MPVAIQDTPSDGLSVMKAVQVIVVAINDGPSIKAPLSIVVKEDIPTSVAGITVEDPDCDDAPRGVLEVAIVASNGTVHFAGSVAGLYLMEALPGTLKIRGKTGPVNAALAGLSYVGAAEFSGADTIVVTADDLGNSGSGGRLSDRWSIDVLVEEINDPPSIVPPPELDLPAGGVLFVLEDEPSSLGTFGVSDVDDIFLRVSVSAKVGSIRIDGIDGASMLVITSSDATQTATGSSVTLEGMSEAVSTALEGLSYTSALNWNSVAFDRDVVEVSRL